MHTMPGMMRVFMALVVLASAWSLLRSPLSYKRVSQTGAQTLTHAHTLHARTLTHTRVRALAMSTLTPAPAPPANPDHVITSKGSVHSIAFTVAGKSFHFETGKMGRQAGGSVVARTENTMIYSTVCNERETNPVDFTPLRVDYFARYSAVGQTVGAFHRRDSRGDDNEILVARLIDRPIRPMITDGWQHETQVLAWLISYDKMNPPAALAICAASAALAISPVPMIRPVAGVEVGMVEGQFVVNPTRQQMLDSPLQLTIAGTKAGILMIEGAADFLPEEDMVAALSMGHKAIGEICDAIEAFQRVAGKPKKTDTLRKLPTNLVDQIDALFGADLTKALSIGDKQKRGAAVGKVDENVKSRFVSQLAPLPVGGAAGAAGGTGAKGGAAGGAVKGAGLGIGGEGVGDSEQVTGQDLLEDSGSVVVDEPKTNVDENLLEDEASEIKGGFKEGADMANVGYGFDPVDVKVAMKKLLVRRLRGLVLNTGLRSDGRSVEEVRPISIDTNLLPGAHGSCLFTRGETQSLSTATLGGKGMEAKFETVDELSAKRFYLQYRFPPSSVGEVGRVGGVNRREVGHGNLAERALLPAIPSMSDFPYSIRAESLITESCGSSSMATVCGCCLAMLDAGVPLKASVAGVAMGLIMGENAGEEPVILTDILGLEDALGTMDFKVAGNESGITTFQLDIKSEGLTMEIIERALLQARRGRLSILANMKAELALPRAMKDTIPRILDFKVAPEFLGKIIGPKGKTVQGLIEAFAVTNINLQDDGTIQVESFSTEKNEEVMAAILKIVSEGGSGRGRGGSRGEEEGPKVELGPPPEQGTIYRECNVKGVHAFGVFVEILPGYEGLVHISELDTKKLATADKLFEVGQKIDVKFLGKNEKGQMRLSRRAVLMRDSGGEKAGGDTGQGPEAGPGSESGSPPGEKPAQAAVASAEAAYGS